MESKVIQWDGTHIPEELRDLPPGRYAIEPKCVSTSLQSAGGLLHRTMCHQAMVGRRASRNRLLGEPMEE